MIENLIYDPKKQILINLELYFESYEFCNIPDFSKIFVNLFKSIFDFSEE